MKKYFFTFLVLLVLLFSLGVYDILSPSFSLMGRDSKILPNKTKQFLKEKIFLFQQN